jgi:hypothetical protein
MGLNQPNNGSPQQNSEPQQPKVSSPQLHNGPSQQNATPPIETSINSINADMKENDDRTEYNNFAKVRKTLRSLKIPERASIIVIGDSVLRHVNPKRLSRSMDSVYKVCVPGMTVEDVNYWLYNLQVESNIQTAILHVGVNSCKNAEIGTESWIDTIQLTKKAFPKAKIALSSTVLAFGRHNMNKVIFASNQNLEKACKKTGVSFIDNFSQFRTESGAPKRTLYKDLTHPSERGTAALAANFISFLRQRYTKTSAEPGYGPTETLGERYIRDGHSTTYSFNKFPQQKQHAYKRTHYSRESLHEEQPNFRRGPSPRKTQEMPIYTNRDIGSRPQSYQPYQQCFSEQTNYFPSPSQSPNHPQTNQSPFQEPNYSQHPMYPPQTHFPQPRHL